MRSYCYIAYVRETYTRFMPRRSSVAVVIPALNPGPELAVTISRVNEVGLPIVVIDDGSRDVDAVRALVSEPAQLITLPRRTGQAAALNTGVRWAAQLDADAVITLDQDTQITGDLLVRLIAQWEALRTTGVPAAAIAPANFGPFRARARSVNGLNVVDEIPQSGALFALEPLMRIGGFDESLVIDGVDSDACLRLADLGLPIVVTPDIIENTIGSGRTLEWGQRRVLLSDHSPDRRYYMTRNRLRLIARHGVRHPRWAARITRAVVVSSALALTMEDHRVTKAKAIALGAADAVRGVTGMRTSSLADS